MNFAISFDSLKILSLDILLFKGEFVIFQDFKENESLDKILFENIWN